MADLYVCPEHGETNPCSGCRATTERIGDHRIGDIKFFRVSASVAPAVDEPHKLINLLTALEHQAHRNHEYHPSQCAECSLTATIAARIREQLGLSTVAPASTVAPQQSDLVDQFEAWINNYWPDWRKAESYTVELMRAAWDAAKRLRDFNELALKGAINHTIELEAKLAAAEGQLNQLTDLQRAIIEHDDDMARLDRNTLVPASTADIRDEAVTDK